jgi:hypothetical protein
MLSLMAGKRSRLITIAAAGTLTVATAVSAVATTLPSGPAEAPAGAAEADLAIVDRHQDVARAAQGDTMSAAQSLLLFDRAQYARIQYGLDERQREHDEAVATAAAKAAAARAAARKAAAAKAAAAKAAAQQAAAAQAATQQSAAQQSATQQSATQQSATQQSAAQAATQQSATQQSATQQSAASTPSDSSQQIAEQMLGQFGWSSSQFSCLQPLWEQESGWDVTAENPSSGAYGIPQALPGSEMASAGADWQTDASTQIRWGLTYIQGRYGSPCGAWAHEEADGWY